MSGGHGCGIQEQPNSNKIVERCAAQPRETTNTVNCWRGVLDTLDTGMCQESSNSITTKMS